MCPECDPLYIYSWACYKKNGRDFWKEWVPDAIMFWMIFGLIATAFFGPVIWLLVHFGPKVKP